VDNYNINAIKSKGGKKVTTYYLGLEQKVEVMTVLNESALVLLEFYYSKIGSNHFEWNKDESTSKALNWKVTKVRDLRQKLQKEGYYTKERYVNNGGKALYDIKLGKEEWAGKTQEDIRQIRINSKG